MRPFTYERATNAAEAAAAAARTQGAKFIAGGTNLLDLMKLEIETPVHLMADRIVDRTPLLDRLGEDDVSPPRPHSSHAQHPRNVRIIPKSRDFH